MAILMATACELAAIFFFFVQEEIGLFFLLHIGASLLIILVAFSLFGMGHKKNLCVFLACVWSFFPMAGALVVFILFLGLPRLEYQGSGALLELIESIEEEEHFFKEFTVELMAERYSREKYNMILSGVSVQPFIDILKSDNTEGKKRVIRSLRFSRTRDAINLLKVAQTDTQFDIRYLSTVALSSIEQDWNREIKVLAREIELDPKNLSLRNEIINSYMLIFGSGLVPDRVAALYLQTALENAEISLQINPKQPDLWIHVGKVRLFQGNYRGALEMFSKAVESEPSNVSYHLWKGEAYYYLRDYSALRKQIMTVKKLPNVSPKVGPIIEYWSANA